MTTKEFYTALKSEIQTDPKTLGYLGESDQWVTDKLNEIEASDETLTVNSVGTPDILKSIVWDEVSGFSAAQIQWINLFTYGEGIDPGNDNIKNMFQGIFAGCEQTLGNLNDIAKRSVSRAEKLGFQIVDLHDVENALHETWWNV